MARLVLAATLGSSYGIYGPAFELCENEPREPGSEEYLNSEKYEIKRWDLRRSFSLRPFISRRERDSKAEPCIAVERKLRFHSIENDQFICYSKQTEDNSNVIVTVVNLDPVWTQSGFLELPLEDLGIDGRYPYHVVDLLTGTRFTWYGPRNYIELRPKESRHTFLKLERIRSVCKNCSEVFHARGRSLLVQGRGHLRTACSCVL